MTIAPFTDGWTVQRLGDDLVTPVVLPHDAMIGERRTADAPSGTHGGFFPGGRYLYRKAWSESAGDGQVRLVFEGVYGTTVVRLNGAALAENVSPYREFEVDLTPALQDGENVLEVEVDNSAAPNSRWYTGSGIYRPVWIARTGVSRFAPDGIRLVTTALGGTATVEVTTEAVGGVPEDLTVGIRLSDGADAVATAEGPPGTVSMIVDRPKPWSAERPHLYELTVELRNGAEVVDVATRKVGLRTIDVDSRRGLRVNGETVLLRGACVHHDNGLLGAATFADAERRRVRILKEQGFNAVRSSHNPLSRSFLDACDELGLYVMDELTDVWFWHKTAHDLADRFAELWPDDARSMIAKDRNHPSVIMYSIGNEIGETATADGIDASRRIDEFVRALDPDRPTTLAINFLLNLMAAGGRSIFDTEKASRTSDADKKPSKATSTMANVMMNRIGRIMGLVSRLPRADKASRGALSHVGVAGYNYGWTRYRGDAKKYPDRVLLGSESMPGDIARIWPQVETIPALIGDFMWTGWDYLGEAGIGSWAYGDATSSIGKAYPHLVAGCGVIDITGMPGAASLLNGAAWHLHPDPAIAVRPLNHAGEAVARTAWRSTDAIESWSWRGKTGTRAEIEVYADADEVELLLNGRSLGRRRSGRGVRYLSRFATGFEPGELTAVAYRGGVESGRSTLRSAADTALTLRAESDVIRADASALAYVWIELADPDGEVEMLDDDDVTIQVEGPAELIAFGSAQPAPTRSFSQSAQPTFYGRALAIVRATGEPGTIGVRASSARHGVARIDLTARTSEELVATTSA